VDRPVTYGVGPDIKPAGRGSVGQCLRAIDREILDSVLTTAKISFQTAPPKERKPTRDAIIAACFVGQFEISSGLSEQSKENLGGFSR